MCVWCVCVYVCVYVVIHWDYSGYNTRLSCELVTYLSAMNNSCTELCHYISQTCVSEPAYTITHSPPTSIPPTHSSYVIYDSNPLQWAQVLHTSCYSQPVVVNEHSCHIKQLYHKNKHCKVQAHGSSSITRSNGTTWGVLVKQNQLAVVSELSCYIKQ